jgi:uncharacterized protein
MPASTTARTPREVFTALIELVTDGKWADISGLYAEDAVAELPFALPAPERLEGRANLHERFVSLAAGGAMQMRTENIRVHQTADPEVIIAEFDYRGQAGPTGRPFHVANIQVLRVRDGLIVATRDFHDHAALAVASGQAPALDEALGGLDLDRAAGGAGV